MELIPHLALVLTACLADGLFGDPVYPLHPIRLLGAWSLWWEKVLFARGLDGHLGGILHWLLVVGAALLVWWGAIVCSRSGIRLPPGSGTSSSPTACCACVICWRTGGGSCLP